MFFLEKLYEIPASLLSTETTYHKINGFSYAPRPQGRQPAEWRLPTAAVFLTTDGQMAGSTWAREWETRQTLVLIVLFVHRKKYPTTSSASG